MISSILKAIKGMFKTILALNFIYINEENVHKHVTLTV